MTYSDAIRFLYDLRWFGTKFGLTNTFKLAALAGNPQQRLRFIHVAGTNGKGSTCAMLESVYRASGLRVGLFTSPHLVAFGERIQVNRRSISETEVVGLVDDIRGLLEQGWPTPGPGVQRSSPASSDAGRGPGDSPSIGIEHPTFFEVVTVMALRYFAARQCDLVIWETGMGGRLDATNIVTPLASVITNIQYDHQKWLGKTLASIAFEKAGIIKPGIPVITGTDAPEAFGVIEKTARERSAPLTVVSAAAMDLPPLDTIQLPLLGRHQAMNAAVTLATVRRLLPQIPVSDDAIQTGLSRIDWPGRLQMVTRPSGQKILLDGAHNIGGAEILAAALKRYFPSAKPALVLGILSDKDWPDMCQILAPLAGRILLAPVQSERTAQPQMLAEVCERANPQVRVIQFPSLRAALADTANDRFVTVAGSLYLVGEAMELLQLSPAAVADERGLNEWKADASSVRSMAAAVER